MKLKKYFEIVKPKYIYLKLTPTTSVRNNNTHQIAKAISSLYKNISSQIYKFEKKFFFEPQTKVSYYIYLEKQKAEFYFIIPETYLQLVKEKIQNSWKGITITEVDKVPLFSTNAQSYYLTYKKEDGLSLQVDKRSNTLLSSQLNVLPVLKEGDKVGIFYNFVPCGQWGWRAKHNKTINKIKDGTPVDRQKTGFWYAMKMLGYILVVILDGIEKAFFTATKTESKQDHLADMLFRRMNSNQLSNATTSKGESIVVNTQILIMSESRDRKQANNNARAVTTSFQQISEDNELEAKKIKSKDLFKNKSKQAIFEPTKLYMTKDYIKASADECSNFIALPGRELLEEHGCIEKIDTFESEVPEELKEGVMCIGESTYRGNKQKAYLSTDKEFKNLTLTLIGPTRAGKTTLISNLSKDAIDNEETTILFDYCGNTDLSDEVSEVIDPSKVLDIDCSDFDKIQGLGYNEVTPKNDHPLEIYKCAKTKTSQLMTLVNSVASEELKDRMERYLEAAAVVVFIQGGTIKDVLGVLQDHRLRNNYINSRPIEQMENLEEYILALEELDEWTKGTKDNPPEIVGTKTSYVQGILNRVSKLKQNTYMELMLKKDCNNNIDLVEEMQKSQLICIRMPETMFSTEQEKDIYATYWLTKIWGALQKRKWETPKAEDRIKVNIVIDELYQVPNCQEFLRSKLSQIAKFTAKPIISCHYLGQIGIIRNELKAANSSYMLIAGCDKDNFKELKSELYPYQEEDLLNLKRFKSLNLIKTKDGYARFITQMPKPL